MNSLSGYSKHRKSLRASLVPRVVRSTPKNSPFPRRSVLRPENKSMWIRFCRFLVTARSSPLRLHAAQKPRGSSRSDFIVVKSSRAVVANDLQGSSAPGGRTVHCARCSSLYRVRYGPPYGNGHAADDRAGSFGGVGGVCCHPRDGDKFHRPADMAACEYTVLPQEMTSSCGSRGAGGCCRSEAVGGRWAVGAGDAAAVVVDDDDYDDGGGPRCYSCTCSRRLPPPVSAAAPRPPDTISYLSGTIDRGQPGGSWRPLSAAEPEDDDVDAAHRHCTCTSGRCRQPSSIVSLPRRTAGVDPDHSRRRQQQLACYVIAATSDEDGDDAATVTQQPPGVRTAATSVQPAQH